MNLRENEIRDQICELSNIEEWGVALQELENQAERNKRDIANQQFWRAMQVQILNLRRNMGYVV